MRLVIAAFAALVTTSVCAIESDPLPVPTGSPREAAVRAYNEGVQRLVERNFAAAQHQFEQALRLEDSLAEAHNNLAFSLRMQGAHNFDRSLKHYNRAIELKPGLAQAYMYRGVLFTQIGDVARARADLQRLRTLDRDLATKLEKVIAGDAGRDGGSAGISAQYE